MVSLICVPSTVLCGSTAVSTSTLKGETTTPSPNNVLAK